VMEEDCDGACLLHLIERRGVRPGVVVLGEPPTSRSSEGIAAASRRRSPPAACRPTGRTPSAASTRSTRWRRSSRTWRPSTDGCRATPSSARAR
jgi:hypothetical protein